MCGEAEGAVGVGKYGSPAVYLRARACVLGYRGHLRASTASARTRMAPSVGISGPREFLTSLLRTYLGLSATQGHDIMPSEEPCDTVSVITWSR